MKKAPHLLPLLLILPLFQGCTSIKERLPELQLPELSMPSIPGIYQADIHQGNIVDQEMVDQLKLGMNKRQVRFIMGSPLLVDTFHQEHWVYFSSKRVKGSLQDQQRISLYFEQEKLARIHGDLTTETSK